jgi:hypothetical protein
MILIVNLERQTKGSSDQVSLTRSVVLNLARLFKAGDERKKSRVASATPEKGGIQSSLRDNPSIGT